MVILLLHVQLFLRLLMLEMGASPFQFKDDKCCKGWVELSTCVPSALLKKTES